eukprot:PhF_6_TR1533/c0_g1_i1/m.2801
MNQIDTVLTSYTSAFTTTIAYFPIRALLSTPGSFQTASGSSLITPEYFITRYKGIVTNPSQPALLALPISYQYLCCSSGNVFGTVFGGIGHGILQNFIAALAARMGETDNKYRYVYTSNLACFKESTAKYGVWSWMLGSSLKSCTMFLLYALPLSHLMMTARPSNQSNFFMDLVHGSLLGCWGVLLSTPTRFMHHAVLSRNFYFLGCHTPQQFLVSEQNNIREGFNVLKTTVMKEGPRNLLRGNVRKCGKTAVPFGLIWALYR